MKFTLKQLGYFIAVGEAGSIAHAAEQIHVSKASISTAITHLEETFNLQLFIRHHAQGVTLTSAGKSLLVEAKTLLRQAEHMRAQASLLSGEIFGSIQLGCFSPLAPIIIPELVHGFMELHQNAVVETEEGNQAQLLDSLKQGRCDLALSYNLQLDEHIEFLPLAQLRPYALLSAKHPLAKAASISLRELRNDRLVLLDLPLSRDYFMSLFSAAKIQPKIYTRTRQTDVVRGLVAKGYGYSIANVRPINQQSLDGSQLVYLPLSDDFPTLTLGIMLLKRLRKVHVIEAFISYCQNKVSQESIPGMLTLY